MAEETATETPQRKITIDGVEYDMSALSDNARNAAANVYAADQELRRLRVQVGIAQAARKSFADTLSAELPADHPGKQEEGKGDGKKKK